jgi:hypothetical protein
LFIMFVFFFFFLRYNKNKFHQTKKKKLESTNREEYLHKYLINDWEIHEHLVACHYQMCLNRLFITEKQKSIGYLLFSFRNLLINFFGCNAPVRRLPDIIIWNKSAKHINKLSFLFFCVKR